MFDNSVFEKWLDTKSQELITKIGNGEPLSSEEMIILVLKAQSNHFHHLDEDIRNDMKELREDFNKDTRELKDGMKELREDFNKDTKELKDDMKEIRKDMDKRFDDMLKRMDRFMIWSLGLVMTSTIFIIKFLG